MTLNRDTEKALQEMANAMHRIMNRYRFYLDQFVDEDDILLDIREQAWDYALRRTRP